jgi:hypothetical protein
MTDCLNQKCPTKVERGNICDACWKLVPWHHKAQLKAVPKGVGKDRAWATIKKWFEGRDAPQ